MTKIVFLGDSHFSQHWTANSPDRMINRIASANGYAAADVINSGVPSDNSGQGLARISPDVIAFAPDVCVVGFMSNDVNDGVPLATYKQNLVGIIDVLKANGIKPVLFSAPLERGGTGAGSVHLANDPFLKTMGDVAREKGVEFVDIYREMAYAYFKRLTNSEFTALYYDATHLSAAGAEYVSEFLSRPQFEGVFTI